MEPIKTIVIEASLNPTKQGLKFSGDGSATMVLDLDAVSAINYAAFYATVARNPGPLRVTIDLLA